MIPRADVDHLAQAIGDRGGAVIERAREGCGIRIGLGAAARPEDGVADRAERLDHGPLEAGLEDSLAKAAKEGSVVVQPQRSRVARRRDSIRRSASRPCG